MADYKTMPDWPENETGSEWLSEPLYQLEAEMDGAPEDI